MIRNSLDHGIETPEARVASGKPAEGTILLSADQRNGRIVIEIVDDGKGIDRQRVLHLARERKLISRQAEPSDEEIDNLIFLPGFSTAEEVSNVSGRGVGMDIVRHNIENIGGRISVQSRPGEGCRIVLTLPVTLAILDGMIVAVDEDLFILPMTSIIETMRPTASSLGRLANKTEVLSYRNEYVRLIHLNRLFGIPAAIEDPTEGLVVLLDTENGGKIAIVVDELLGQQQVVIKSLESNCQHVEGVSGVTILGNGMVALILDGASLEAMATPADAPVPKQIMTNAEYH
jgi:two-component system chemotaxis sensor kinase CheA